MLASCRTRPLATYLPLLWMSVAFVAGALLASQKAVTVGTMLAAAAGAFLLTVVLAILRWRWEQSPALLLLFPLCALTFFLGAARYQSHLPRIDWNHIAWYNDRGEEVLVTGMLVEPPDERDAYLNLRIEAQKIDWENGQARPIRGLLLARLPSVVNLDYGDLVRVRGYLVTPPQLEDFSYRDHLNRQGIFSLMEAEGVTDLHGNRGKRYAALLYLFREKALHRLYQLFPDPEASLLAGILLGKDTNLSPDLRQAFKDTGTAHIIAISGFNIAIIAGLFVSLFSRLWGPWRGLTMAALAIGGYTILVGAEASVVRAGIMGAVALFGQQLGRRSFGLTTLAFTAAVMCALDPFVPWDIGFQLSFGATLGLILYAQPIQDWAERLLARRTSVGIARHLARLLAEYFLFTLAAQLTTIPLTAYYFKRLPLVSLLANPFILPAQPPVMVLSGLALLLGLVWQPAGQMLAYIAWPFPAYTIRAVEFFQRLPHGVIMLGKFSFWFLIAFYWILLTMTFIPIALRKKLQPLLSPAFILAVLGIAVFLTWSAVFRLPDGRLHVTFLDVGSADAILIQTPLGGSVLINGGAIPSQLSDSLGRHLSPFHRELDWLVVASTQENQLAALPRVLERYPPRAVLWSGPIAASSAARQLDRWLARSGVPVTYASVGSGLDLGSGCRLEVVDASSRGAVLLLSWGGFRALLPIGPDQGSLNQLQYGQKIGRVSLLLLAESGYALYNPPEWFENLQPQLVLLSVAAGDPNALPHWQTLETVQGYPLLRTDRQGWIQVSTDGTRLWITGRRR